ncbi:homocysteine S-methyltransferase [Streptococcus himalayensis]|uniref:S-methylmethionine:homocysteine methyltransferase n=1 Tax=Streptococcus himalayensis TaxID=1888195 RepID=A0A917A4G6_9STRE|nr:homocysteine S-methyltransferase [Streptococcus himalayensis]GGE26756.1 homocysteine S-methyltransferase [Streptococcus himalayensis]
MGRLKEALEARECLILDGALGTELESQGYDVTGKLWSAKYLLDNPRVIADLHDTYLLAGADIVTTSSYQATVPGLCEAGLSEQDALRIIALTVTLARESRDRFWTTVSDEEKEKRLYPLISGDVGPYAAYLADGSEYTGAYDLTTQAYKDFHRPRIQTLLEAGSDFLGIETIPNIGETKALLDLLETEFPEAESYISFVAKDDGHLSDGTPIEEVGALCQTCPQIVAVGVNCSAPHLLPALLARLQTVTTKPLVAYPNSGEVYNGATQTWHQAPDNSKTLAENAKIWQSLGTKILGGCCRTRPADIAYLAETLKK